MTIMNEGNFVEKDPAPGDEDKEQKSESYEHSLEVAREIWKGYKEQIRVATITNPDPEVSRFKENEAIRHFLRKVPEDIQQRFTAHGITKREPVEQLAALLNVCINKAMKGMYGPLRSEPYSAYTHGLALIVSKPGKSLGIKDANQKQIWNEVIKGIQIDIGAVVLNSSFYPLYDELKKRFPEVNIIKANQLPGYLVKE
jgi:hypothetical protein